MTNLFLFTNLRTHNEYYTKMLLAGVKPQSGTFGKLYAIRIGNRFKSQINQDNTDWPAELRRQLKEINNSKI